MNHALGNDENLDLATLKALQHQAIADGPGLMRLKLSFSAANLVQPEDCSQVDSVLTLYELKGKDEAEK